MCAQNFFDLRVKYFLDSSEVFPSVDIKGGVAITLWDKDTKFDPIGLFVVHKELKQIMKKVLSDGFKSFSDIIYTRDLYRLTEDMYKDNPWADNRQAKGHRYDVGSNIDEILPEIFTESMLTIVPMEKTTLKSTLEQKLVESFYG